MRVRTTVCVGILVALFVLIGRPATIVEANGEDNVCRIDNVVINGLTVTLQWTVYNDWDMATQRYGAWWGDGHSQDIGIIAAQDGNDGDTYHTYDEPGTYYITFYMTGQYPCYSAPYPVTVE
jgi:hypothetical protein